MFSRDKSAPGAKQKPGKAGTPGLSFIGPEVVVRGDIETGATLHVDGRIDGNVRCGQLCQGATGAIAGDIAADEARLAGSVEGTVDARMLTVEASARIAGDVAYETISIAAGARIDGRLARRAALAAGAEDKAPVLIATPTGPGESAATTDPRGLFPLAGQQRAAAG